MGLSGGISKRRGILVLVLISFMIIFSVYVEARATWSYNPNSFDGQFPIVNCASTCNHGDGCDCKDITGEFTCGTYNKGAGPIKYWTFNPSGDRSKCTSPSFKNIYCVYEPDPAGTCFSPPPPSPPPTPAVCGNGDNETGEECDDGNTNNGDGCSKDCEIETPQDQCALQGGVWLTLDVIGDNNCCGGTYGTPKNNSDIFYTSDNGAWICSKEGTAFKWKRAYNASGASSFVVLNNPFDFESAVGIKSLNKWFLCGEDSRPHFYNEGELDYNDYKDVGTRTIPISTFPSKTIPLVNDSFDNPYMILFRDNTLIDFSAGILTSDCGGNSELNELGVVSCIGAGSRCNLGVGIPFKDDDGVCCVGPDAACALTPPPKSCDKIEYADCGSITATPSLMCAGPQQIIYGGVNNNHLCCEKQSYCTYDRSKILKTAGYFNIKDSLLCNEFNGGSYLTECCNDYINCTNAGMNLRNSLSYNRNAISMGSPLNQLESFDFKKVGSNIIPNRRGEAKIKDLADHYHLFETSSPFETTSPPFSNNILPALGIGPKYDKIQFFMYIDSINNRHDYDLSKLNLSLVSGTNTGFYNLSLKQLVDKHLAYDTWLKVTIDLSKLPKKYNTTYISEINIIRNKDSKKNYEFSSMKVYVEQLSAVPDSSVDTQAYCTPLRTWISDEIDAQIINPTLVAYDWAYNNDKLNIAIPYFNSFKNTKEYIEYKWTCDMMPGYGWTGIECCGEMQSSFNPSVFYTDYEGGCWNGMPMYDNEAVGEKTYKKADAYDRYMFFNGTFRECGYKSLSKPSAMSADFKNTIEKDDYCGYNWDYFCDYGDSMYKPTEFDGKKRDEKKAVYFGNQIFNGGFNEE